MGFGLVLGGGGAVGVGWEIAVLAALESAGSSVRGAEVVVGTSAGSIVGLQVFAGRSFDDMLAEMAVTESPRQLQEDPVASARDLAEAFGRAARAPDPQSRARELGAISLSAPTMSETAFLGMMAAMLQVSSWPTSTRFMPTAADCESGERIAWEATGDVDVVAAVASSCSVPGMVPPVTIRGHRYADGGIWSPSNLDVVVGTGVDRAIFIGPFGGPDSPVMGVANADLAAEARIVADAGIATLVLTPGPELRREVGADMMNVALRPAAVAAGKGDGADFAPRVREFLDA
jgi:NTE family protein